MKKVIFAILALCCLAPVLASCNKEEPEQPKATLKTPILTAKAEGETIKLQWNMVTNALSFQIESKLSTEAEFAPLATATNSPYIAQGLDFGKSYDFRIKAIGNNAESEWSKVATATLERYLDKPTASAIAGMSYIDVSWEAVNKAASYKVEHKTALDATFTTDYEGTGDELLSDGKYTFRITDLSGGITYDVRVAASAAGYSDTWSEPATVTTTAAAKNMIRTADELIAWLAACTGDETSDDVTALANDIDMTGKTIASAKAFCGVLEGQGFAIKNLLSDKPLFKKFSGNLSNVVIDGSCKFTAGSQIFGAISAEDSRAVYTNVINKASVTLKATANVTGAVAIGGFAGFAESDTFNNCENAGEVKFDATGFTHEAAFVGGFVGLASEHLVFESCKNSAPVTLTAVAGNPKTAVTVGDFSKNNAGIAVGGFVARQYDSFDAGADDLSKEASESSIYIHSCENTATATVTLNHTDISQVSGDGAAGNVSVGGFVGHGNSYIQKSTNNGNVVAKGISASGGVSKKEYMLRAGGLHGHVYDYVYINSSRMNGDLTYENDCVADNSNMKPGVGGLIANGGYNGVSVGGLAEVFYNTMAGSITVRGNGKNFCVGGISGFNSKQVCNKVLESCTIDCSINNDYILVGGLVGSNAGAYQNYTCSGCSCAATIKVESTNGTDAIRAGGLLGCWVGAQGESFYARDGVPSSFSGSVSSTTQKNCVGILFGEVGGSGKSITFGKTDYPIKVSGKFGRADVALTDIDATILDTYKCGKLVNTTTVFNVQYGTVE